MRFVRRVLLEDCTAERAGDFKQPEARSCFSMLSEPKSHHAVKRDG
jgi:hypothetical protein